MNRSISMISLVMCCLVAVACSGCIGSDPGNQTLSPTPTGTPVPVGNLVVNESQNTAMVYMNQSKIITVRLAENPTTGFQWNLTTTPGLRIVKDEYIPADTSGKMVGAGGTHVWDISTELLGQQEIQAVYKRSWEPTTGNESTFSMKIVVT
ncbi:MAG TPA: protease inhibitor I42 family protein [Methanoregula sp.]|nr:protease inhibitor I42 family protein [Methanoregula sp.]